jgi:hypothetical protein
MFIHVFFMFPETAGKSLEEVEGMFLDPKGFKYLGTPAWRTAVVTRTLGLDPHEKMFNENEMRTSDEEKAVRAPTGPADEAPIATPTATAA